MGNGNTVQISLFSGNIFNPQFGAANTSNNTATTNVAAGNGNNSQVHCSGACSAASCSAGATGTPCRSACSSPISGIRSGPSAPETSVTTPPRPTRQPRTATTAPTRSMAGASARWLWEPPVTVKRPGGQRLGKHLQRPGEHRPRVRSRNPARTTPSPPELKCRLSSRTITGTNRHPVQRQHQRCRSLSDSQSSSSGAGTGTPAGPNTINSWSARTSNCRTTPSRHRQSTASAYRGTSTTATQSGRRNRRGTGAGDGGGTGGGTGGGDGSAAAEHRGIDEGLGEVRMR